MMQSANLFAPTITSAPQITGIPAQGETVTITNATASGTQPITITDTLALGSGDVTGDISGGQYTIPPTATVGQTLTLTSVASNGIAPDAQDSVSVTVQEALFTPADVFGATDIGLFNRIHPDNLFTDTNGTINATVGDDVAYIEDLSGNENHRIQATVSRRPTLQQDPNGAYKLVYDGVDDFIDVTYSGVISTPISTVNVVRKAPNRRVLNETTDSSPSVLFIGISGDGTLRFYAKPGGGVNSSADDISIPLGVEILILGTVWAQENSLYRINGVQNTGVFDPGPNSGTTGYRPAANNANPPTDYTTLEEYGAIQIDRELTTEQFEKLEDYFKLEVGITPPDKMTVPSILGATGSATLVLGPKPDDNLSPIEGYEFEVTAAADVDFANVVSSGMQTTTQFGEAIVITGLTSGGYIARQRAENGNGFGEWSDPSNAVTVSDTVPSLSYPTFADEQVFTPDPTQAEVVISDEAGAGLINGKSAYPCVVDVRSMPEFDGVTNGLGERLNWLVYGSNDHSPTASTYLHCVFGAFRGGTWKTYADALAAGDLSSYSGAAPATDVNGGVFNHNPSDPISSETPWVWKEGNLWYLTYHGFYGELAQTTQYATSSTPFGNFVNQGGFLETDSKSDHNGYARMLPIPPEADVGVGLVKGETGQFLITALNNSSGSETHYSVHVANRDLTEAELITPISFWGVDVPASISSDGFMRLGSRLTPTAIKWLGNEFSAIFDADIDGGSVLVESGVAPNLIDYTRDPKVILHPNELNLLDTSGNPVSNVPVQVDWPQIIEDDGESWLLVWSSTSTSVAHFVTMPITINDTAQGVSPRVYEDHYFEEVNFAEYTDLAEVPAAWGHGGVGELKNSRLEVGTTGLTYAPGFDPSVTDWFRVYADGAKGTDPGDERPIYIYQVSGGSSSFRVFETETPFINTPTTGRRDLSPPDPELSICPGGWEWDLANATLQSQRGNSVARYTHDVLPIEMTELSAQQMYPNLQMFASSDPVSIGNMMVQMRGPGYTNNAAPHVASASTDASGSKISVKLDRNFLGLYGFVVSVGTTIINTTPSRTAKDTVDLVRDAGSFGPSDEIKLHYRSGGDVRSDPQWVRLAEISGINVVNNV